MHSYFSEELEIQIIEAFKAGESISSIRTRLGLSPYKVTEFLKEKGLKTRSWIRVSIDHQKVIELYQSGMSCPEIAKLLGYKRCGVHRALTIEGIKPRTVQETSRTDWFDESFFDLIDTEEKAYWLGFIAADGYLNHNSWLLRLELQEQDKYHLEKLKQSLNSNKEIQTFIRKFGKQKTLVYLSDRTFTHVRFAVNSKHLITALNNLGIVQKKSKILKPCTQVPDHLLKHYWRGLVDGDGSVVCTEKTKSLILCGTYDIVKGFIDFLKPYYPSMRLGPSKRKGCENLYYAVISGKDMCPALIKVLYEGATVYLDRKYKKAMEILSLS